MFLVGLLKMIGEGAAEADGVKQVTSGRWVNTVVGALQAWMVPSYVLAQDKVQLVTSYGGGNLSLIHI